MTLVPLRRVARFFDLCHRHPGHVTLVPPVGVHSSRTASVDLTTSVALATARQQMTSPSRATSSRQLDDVCDVLQECVPVARVLPTHCHFLAEETAVSIAEDAEPLGVFRLVHSIESSSLPAFKRYSPQAAGFYVSKFQSPG